MPIPTLPLAAICIRYWLAVPNPITPLEPFQTNISLPSWRIRPPAVALVPVDVFVIFISVTPELCTCKTLAPPVYGIGAVVPTPTKPLPLIYNIAAVLSPSAENLILLAPLYPVFIFKSASDPWAEELKYPYHPLKVPDEFINPK